ncbi:MAG: divalent-cation tolerance protein CutA [Verrucomicrobiota bacterium]|nr:divalent-cation tolerance protein CutA [Limisphaera sp.]MDW8382347.1 divalent-cation tolerance protein CutA [Verrucomicrobiota bacterium]
MQQTSNLAAISDLVLVLVTAPDMNTARRLATCMVEARLAACVNLLPAVESHYWWQGKIEQSPEVLLICKTLRACLAALQALVRREHPYQVPEFVVVPVQEGLEAYIDWVRSECRPKG